MRYSSVSRVQGGDFPVFSENTTRPLTQRESGGHDRKRGLKERFSPSIPLIAVFKIWLEIRHVGRTLLYRNNSLLPPMGGGHRGQAVSPRCGCDFFSRSWNGCFRGWGNGTKNQLKNGSPPGKPSFCVNRCTFGISTKHLKSKKVMIKTKRACHRSFYYNYHTIQFFLTQIRPDKFLIVKIMLFCYCKNLCFCFLWHNILCLQDSNQSLDFIIIFPIAK